MGDRDIKNRSEMAGSFLFTPVKFVYYNINQSNIDVNLN